MRIKGKVKILKGCARIQGRRVPRGRVAFYWKTSRTRGVKVFYGLQSRMETSNKKTAEIYRHMRTLYRLGVGVKPYALKGVSLDITCNGKRIRKVVPAIEVEHCKKHKDHGSLGKFKKRLRKVVKQTGISNCADSFKNVNIMWSPRTSSWRLVDVR